MTLHRLLLAIVLCGVLTAQQPGAPAAEEPPAFRTTVDVVVAPVTVYDRDGAYVNNLQPNQFHLYDNNKEQDIKVDVAYQPISIVIAVQASAHVESILPQVRKIGSLIAPLIIGDQGEAAVVAYDSRIRTLQPFTSDPDKITDALKQITAGSMSNRMVDAVEAGTRMLRTRPQNRRRIMLLIGETRDLGSEGRTRETLMNLQLANVVFYSVDMARAVGTLFAKPPTPRSDPTPPAMHPVPSGVAATPNTVMQTWGTAGARAEFIPLMVELFKDVKAVFKDNPVELFTKGTGGTEYGFVRQRGLEEAVGRIGEELHSQYMITYNPNNKDDGGFHEIFVQVAGHADYKVQTRPGYWLAVK